MDQSLTELMRPVTRFIKQYHATIMILIVAILIGLAIFRLTQIIALSNETGAEGYTPVSRANGNFDQETIRRIDQLKSKNDTKEPLLFPERRTSPFSE